ncbi:hypothetical protein [Acidovorax sp. Root70]|uniref:hypothetical protein n=1 Tax=Acidovorax sp. Root70 TaxID=1736590 RepID=UPI000AB122EA|nr:hypothetical protein [Acidovorax sp. Root70]
MRIDIIDPVGNVVNTITADPAFANAEYPGAWRQSAYQDPEPTPRELILRHIKQLEDAENMPRVTRESLIAMAEERGLAAGLTLEQLRVKNKGYAGLKALDEQIAALRAQL